MPQHAREPLTSDEVDSLIKSATTHDERLVIFCLLDTGLRVAELASIRRDSIDYQTHRITIMGKGRGGPGRARMTKRRVLKLNPRLKELLEPYMLTRDGFDMSVKTIQRHVSRVANRARIRRACSPHVLRHTFAVQSLQDGVSLATLQHWMGHASLTTTAIYLNLSPDAALKEMEEKRF